MTSQESQPHRRKVLVVDDEPDIRMLTRMMLEGAGHEVIEAESGERCLEIVQSDTPDLILLDIRLPGIDGWGVLEKITTRTVKKIPVVMMSAHSSEGTLARAAKAGSVGYLIKPFKEAELLRYVDKSSSN
ncbi:MAG: two-component system, NtrC family, nitrogen regulation response regulator NtrX [Actinomycetota bacterium]|nr:two-component system, NtrC family, nitrogen regulation response regulator NtrX [Actinomycetota bacterium]